MRRLNQRHRIEKRKSKQKQQYEKGKYYEREQEINDLAIQSVTKLKIQPTDSLEIHKSCCQGSFIEEPQKSTDAQNRT